MRSQDNIKKVVFTGNKNIKDDSKNIIYCLCIEWQIFLFACKINKFPEKNGSMLVPITSHKQKNTSAKRIFINLHGTWNDNMRSVILDWRQRSSGHSSEGERSTGLSSKGGERPGGHSSRHISSSCVFCRRTTSQKRSPPQNKDTWELSLTLFLLHTIVTVEE